MNKQQHHTLFTAAIAFILSASACLHALADTDEDFVVDPTAPPLSSSADSAKPLLLSAIFVAGNVRYATLNGKNLRVGQQTDGATIIAISNTTVEVEIAGERQTLALFAAVNIKAAQGSRQEK